jgi:ABC-type nitrate/sulfonate/bicarbonate transport system permease component
MMKRISAQDVIFILGGVCVLLSLLGIWQLVSIMNVLPRTVFPPASIALQILFSQIQSGLLLTEFEATLFRLFEGYLIAAALGISIGVAMGLSKTVEYVGDPLVQFLRPMPSAVLIPLAILYFGLGNFMIISIVIYACMWPILINTFDGVKDIEPIILDTAREYQVKGLTKIWKVVLPASSPLIFSGLRVSLAVAWIVTITAEILSTATTTGLGAAIFLDLNSGNLAAIYATIIAIVIGAYALNRLFLFVESLIIPWHQKLQHK